MKTSPILCLVLALAPACSSISSGADTPPTPAFAPIAGDDGLLLWTAGADTWLVDPKDAKLRETLSLLPARVEELPEEVGQPIPADAVRLVLEMLASPMCLRAGMLAPKDASQIPFYAQLTFRASSPAEAQSRAARVGRLMQMAGMPSLGANEAMHGLMMMPVGPVQAYLGVPKDGPTDTFVVSAGAPRLETPELGTLDLPAGVKPYAAFKVDYRVIARGLAMAGPEAQQALTMMGMSDVVLQGGMGTGADRTYGSLRTIGWVPAQKKMSLMPSRALARNELELIPADATFCMLGRMDMNGIVTTLRAIVKANAGEMGMPEDTDPVELLANMTGFDLQGELFDHLGQTWGAYMSDSSGGGGFLSMVAFLEIKDPKGFADTLERMETQIDDLGKSEAHGYVGVRHTLHDKQDVATFAFPGLPIPLEISYAQANGYFFVALSHQALLAGIAQSQKPASSLLDNERFREVAPGSLDDLYSLSYTDVPRFARDGWGTVNMAAGMLTNAMSSPKAPERAPSAIVPAFHDLLKGAKASASLGRLDGDDLVLTTQGDRSMLVNTSGAIGLMGPIPMMVGAGIAMFGIAKEHEAHAMSQAVAAPAMEEEEGEDDEMDETEKPEIVPDAPKDLKLPDPK